MRMWLAHDFSRLTSPGITMESGGSESESSDSKKFQKIHIDTANPTNDTSSPSNECYESLHMVFDEREKRRRKEESLEKDKWFCSYLVVF